MFDVWIGNVNLALVTLIIAAVVLPVQLLLCFKVKPLAARLAPAVIFAFLTVGALVASIVSTGAGSVAYLFIVVYLAFLLFVCGLGWGIWAMARRAKSKGENQ